MAKPSFNFGANRKAKGKKAKKARGGKKRSGSSGKSNAWRAYVSGGISNAPIPD